MGVPGVGMGRMAGSAAVVVELYMQYWLKRWLHWNYIPNMNVTIEAFTSM